MQMLAAPSNNNLRRCDHARRQLSVVRSLLFRKAGRSKALISLRPPKLARSLPMPRQLSSAPVCSPAPFLELVSAAQAIELFGFKPCEERQHQQQLLAPRRDDDNVCLRAVERVTGVRGMLAGCEGGGFLLSNSLPIRMSSICRC